MATIQRGHTKVANKLVNYVEKRAEVIEGVDCPAAYAKAQMKATRALWGKTEGIQAHHVIQSFEPGETTPEQANEIGQKLAKETAPGFEAVVYTHTDKDHIHNHIVINAVSFETGAKYHASKDKLYDIREVSDRLCQEQGLSVVSEPAAIRYTLAEQSLLERGARSWKDDIRQVVDHEKTQETDWEGFKTKLTDTYGITVTERGKHVTFTHPENGRKVRGRTLGAAYEKETIQNELTRQVERATAEEKRERNGVDPAAGRNEGIERPHAELHPLSHGQGRGDGTRLPARDRTDAGTDESDRQDARRAYTGARQSESALRRSITRAYADVRKKDGRNQREGDSALGEPGKERSVPDRGRRAQAPERNRKSPQRNKETGLER